MSELRETCAKYAEYSTRITTMLVNLLYENGIKSLEDFKSTDLNDILGTYGCGPVYGSMLKRMKEDLCNESV